MPGVVREVLLRIRTVAEMIEAFAEEERCRRLLEALVGPMAGCVRHVATSARLRWRDATWAGIGRGRAYQCCNGACRFQFTATTRTSLHATKPAAEHLAQGI